MKPLKLRYHFLNQLIIVVLAFFAITKEIQILWVITFTLLIFGIIILMKDWSSYNAPKEKQNG